MTVFGALLCQGDAIASDEVVTVYQHTAGTPGFAIVGTATTEADGSYQFAPASFDTNSAFYVRSHGAHSAHRVVKVAAQVTLRGAPDGTQLFTGGAHAPTSAHNKVTFTGTVSPADAGALVVLQRENATGNEEWRRIGLGQINENGEYSITHAFRLPGEANIRVIVRARGLNLPAASAPLSYEISQRQNPRLTVHPSADPISSGQPVTISGVLAAGANQPVTLLGHTRGHAFAIVAEAKTDGAGNYSFPAQSPPQSAFYRVSNGATRSAVLFEAVKYELHAAPSAASVQAGQALTFSGTVSPAHAGQAVYLERRNASGIGFHVVDVGTVSDTSTYSIAHTFYDPGPGFVRIRVPGDQDNQAKASESFAIQVTPAAAAALGVKAPVNPPGEGPL